MYTEIKRIKTDKPRENKEEGKAPIRLIISNCEEEKVWLMEVITECRTKEEFDEQNDLEVLAQSTNMAIKSMFGAICDYDMYTPAHAEQLLLKMVKDAKENYLKLKRDEAKQ